MALSGTVAKAASGRLSPGAMKRTWQGRTAFAAVALAMPRSTSAGLGNTSSHTRCRRQRKASIPCSGAHRHYCCVGREPATRIFPPSSNWSARNQGTYSIMSAGSSSTVVSLKRYLRRGTQRGLASSSSSISQSARHAGQIVERETSASIGRNPQVANPGTVYFVATPIGNLEDITLRAINILRTADVIAAEDTRTTGSLLKLLGVERKGKLVSHHDHNTRRRVPEIVEAAREGKSVAVVSDAGTPGISDPGMELAAACAAEGVRVVPVPGACAAVAAISVTGFPSHEFVFYGFVSGKRGSAVRRRKLTEIAQEARTCIMYESPHRIADTLRGLLAASCSPPTPPPDCEEGSDGGGASTGSVPEAGKAAPSEEELVAGRRPVVLARELTKLHEEIFRGTLAEAVARYGGSGTTENGGRESDAPPNSDGKCGGGGGPAVKEPRGEFTVVLGPRAAVSAEDGGVEGAARALAVLEARLLELMAGGMSTSSAVKMTCKDLNLKKSDVYRVALRLQPSAAVADDV
ncbi:unnamed protein product [Scytosiphon promiscuus]